MTPLSTRAVTDQALSHPAALGGPCAALGSTAGALGPPDGLLGHAGPQGYARAPMGAVGGWAGRWQRVTTLRCAARCAQRPPLVACRRPLGAPGAPNQLQRFGAQGRGARRGLGTPLGHPSPARPVGATSQGGADATAAPVPHGPGRGRTRAWQVGTPNDADGPRGWSCGRGVGTGLLAPNVAGSRLKKGLPGLPRARAEVPSPGPASAISSGQCATWHGVAGSKACRSSRAEKAEAEGSHGEQEHVLEENGTGLPSMCHRLSCQPFQVTADSLLNALDNRLLERKMVCRVLRVQTRLFDKRPEALKQIEVGRVGRQAQPRHAAPLRQPLSQRAALLAGMVKHDRAWHA